MKKRKSKSGNLSTDVTSVDPKLIQREKNKARELRKTQWWQSKLQAGICHYCSEGFGAAELTMDHVIPVSRGGKSTKGNVVAACKGCNNKKKYLTPVDMILQSQPISK